VAPEAEEVELPGTGIEVSRILERAGQQDVARGVNGQRVGVVVLGVTGALDGSGPNEVPRGVELGDPDLQRAGNRRQVVGPGAGVEVSGAVELPGRVDVTRAVDRDPVAPGAGGPTHGSGPEV